MQRSLEVPRGRSELLLWLNSLCSAEYPAVECLRDGAAYCTVIEAAVSRIAQNCVTLDSTEGPAAARKARRAAVVLAKLDWTATPIVCEDIDPSLDSITVRATCRKNVELLQDLVRECVPTDCVHVIDVERLATGKLQDHVKFLQWLYQFMSKVLANYSKQAIERRAAAREGAGVSGVKLNRTTELLRQRATATMPGERAVSAVVGHTSDPRVVSSPRQQQLSEEEGSVREARNPPQSATPRSAATACSSTPAAAPSSSSLVTTDSPHYVPTTSTLPSPPSSSRAAVERTCKWAYYPKGTVTVPAVFKDLLVGLRSEVEEVEALTLNASDAHQFSLTRTERFSERVPYDTVRGALTRPEYQPAGDGTLSLEELGKLLEERDGLSQLYVAVAGIANRHNARGVPTPLLKSLNRILNSAPLS